MPKDGPMNFFNYLGAMVLTVLLLTGAVAQAAPTLTTPTVSGVGSNMATLILQSNVAGTGYFTILTGTNATCGGGDKVKEGKDSNGTLTRHGSLPLTANSQGRYTVRNLKQSTGYTVCFTADDGQGNYQNTPAHTNFTTTAPPDLTTSAWTAVGMPGFTSLLTCEESLAYAHGTPYLSYMEPFGYIWVMKYNALTSTWESAGLASTGPSMNTSLAFSPAGFPYVAFDDGSTWDHHATTVKYDGANWGPVGGWFYGRNLSVAFAPDGNPWVAFKDDTINLTSDAATVRKFNGSGWALVGQATFSGGAVDFISLAFAPDGTPYVAYSDIDNGRKAAVRKFDGTGWVAVGNSTLSEGQADDISLAITPDGVPQVVYSDYSSGMKATVKSFTGSAWTTVGNAGFSDGVAHHISLAIAPDGKPYVAYMDAANSDKATVRRFNGVSWENAGGAGLSDAKAHHEVLIYAPDGPYLAYMDDAHGGAGTVKKLVQAHTVTYNGNGATGGTPPSDGIYPPGTRVTVPMNGSLTRTGFALVAWNTQPDGSGTSYAATGSATFTMGTADIALYAQWAPAYTVTYNGNGATSGSVPVDNTPYVPGRTVIVSDNIGNLTKPNLTLAGWNTAADGSGTRYAASGMDTFTMGSANVVLYAQWAPALAVPTTSNIGANTATLNLQSSATGTGYFTLLAGNDASCGSGTQVRNGKDSTGTQAFRSGSLPLAANTPASYTVRYLTQSTDYTVCFTADDGMIAELQPTPVTVHFATTAATDLAANVGWTAVGGGFSGGQAQGTSLAFAPDGTPYVAYRDAGNGKGMVRKYNGAAWVSVGDPGGFSAGSVYYTALSFAPDGTPYVVYQDDANNYRVSVVRYHNQAWEHVGSAVFSAGTIYTPSLAFAPDGTPYVAYADYGSGQKARVQKFNGTAWVDVGSVGISASTAQSTSLAFGPDGSPYVAYEDWANGQGITVKKFNGTGWADVGNAGFSIAQASEISLSFASDGTPYVAYRDSWYGPGKATVQKYNGTAWVVVGSAGFTAETALSNSLAFAPDGTPYLAHMYGVMKYDGAAWVHAESVGSSATSASPTSLTFGPDGKPYVAGRTTVMKLAQVHTVAFDSSGGSAVAGQMVADAATATPPAAPTKTGFDFAGWHSDPTLTSAFDFNTPITADISLYAKWINQGSIVAVPTVSNLGANLATLDLMSSADGMGYFTLLAGSNAPCGTGEQVRNGLNSTGAAALRFGSLPLVADTAGHYTVRNLMQNTGYTVCFTADEGTTLQPVPVSANLVTPAARDLAGSVWNAVGSAGFSAGSAAYESLALAPDGTPYVAFMDGLYGNRATVMKFNGTSWSVVGAPGFSAGAVTYIPLAIAPDGTPYVAYKDGVYGNKAVVMKYDNATSAWVNVGTPGFSAGIVNDPALAFAPDGTPYMAYQDGANGQRATVQKFVNGAWTLVGSAGFSAGIEGYTSLAFAPDGTPYVSYQDYAYSSRVTVKKFENGSWVTVGSPGFSSGTATFTFLAFTPDGKLYVAYKDYPWGYRATVMTFENGLWKTVGNKGFSSATANWITLAFAPDGTPYVAYEDGARSNKATVMKFENGAWVAAGSAGFSAGGAYCTSLAFGPDGTPYVAYQDAASSNRATMKQLR